MNYNEFIKIPGIKEEYEICDKLMDTLLGNGKDIFLKNLCDNGFDISKDDIREIFENELANRKSLKQDYTPSCLCNLISRLCGNQGEILDVCCGVGSLSVQCIVNQNCHSFCFEEISNVSISMLLLNLAIRNTNATVLRKDVLSKKVYEVYKLRSQETYSSIEKIVFDDQYDNKKFDCIISNPPYSLKWDPPEIDARYQKYGYAPKSKADYAFVLDVLYRLSENGKAYIILPHGILFRGAEEGKIRREMLINNVIDCIIGLPEKLFLNTQIPTIILCLRKNRSREGVMFIDASQKYQKVGKQNVLSESDIKNIINAYTQRKDIDKFSRRVPFAEIEKNDFNLNIPRYVDTFEEPERIDIVKTIDEIVQIENEIHKVDSELAKMFGNLKGDSDYEAEKKRIITLLTTKYVHDMSNILDKINKYFETEKELAKHKTVDLLKIVDVERSKKKKIYKKGNILIQLSATKGQMVYLDEDSEVDSKYGVFIANDDINPKYLYYILTMTMPQFLNIYQTGLNIVPDVFEFMKIEIHTDRQVQNDIVKMFDELSIIEKQYQEEIEKWKDVKTFHLDNMFPKGVSNIKSPETSLPDSARREELMKQADKNAKETQVFEQTSLW